MRVRGTWHDSLQIGKESDRPSQYLSDGELMFFLATDTGKLYVSARPASGNTASWVEVAKTSDVPTLPAFLENIPDTDPEDGVTVWNDEGVLKVASPAP